MLTKHFNNNESAEKARSLEVKRRRRRRRRRNKFNNTQRRRMSGDNLRGEKLWRVFVLKCKYCTCRSLNPRWRGHLLVTNMNDTIGEASERLLSSAENQGTLGSIAGRDGGKKNAETTMQSTASGPNWRACAFIASGATFTLFRCRGWDFNFICLVWYSFGFFPRVKWPICTPGLFWSIGWFCRSNSLAHPWITL